VNAAKGKKGGETIAFDIEVAGFDWEEIDEATRGYLLERERDPAERARVPDRTALYPGCGRVVAIGLWSVDRDEGAVFVHGKGKGELEPWERFPGSRIFRASEEKMLERFWERVREFGRLVSFNGRGYDGPVLMIRSAMLGIAPSRNLAGYRYDASSHCDLMDVLSFFGAMRASYSLEYWCRRFGIESPKAMLDGSQVGRAFREGRLDDIAEYCLRDARATAELFRKVERSLLPLM
jgi:hypothetical protein